MPHVRTFGLPIELISAAFFVTYMFASYNFINPLEVELYGYLAISLLDRVC